MSPEQRKAHRKLLTSLPSRKVVLAMEPEEVYVLTGNVRVETWLLEDRPLSPSERKYLWRIEPQLSISRKSKGSFGTEHFPTNNDEARCFI